MIWIAILGCLVISFVFSGIEAGLLSVNRVRLKHRLKHRDKAAITLNRLLGHPERLLVTVLLVTNLMNIFAATLATQQAVAYLGDAGYFAALVLFLPVYLIGLELLPKSLFRRFPYRSLASLSARCVSPTSFSRPSTSSARASPSSSSAPAPATGRSSSSPAKTSNTSPSRANAKARSAATSAR